MTLVERITQDLTASMKAQDAARTSTLRMAKAALKNKEIDKKAPLDDAEAHEDRAGPREAARGLGRAVRQGRAGRSSPTRSGPRSPC